MELSDRFPTPFLVASLDKVEENYRFFQEHLPRVKVYYAVKANATEGILRRMADMGSGFDVASEGEMALLSSLGVSGDRMIYANPTKTIRGLEKAVECGITRFTYDAFSEVGKIADAVPGGSVLLRISVPNEKSMVDLNTKFGASTEKAIPLLKAAAEAGLDVAGLAFHVGSQSLAAAPYEQALTICRQIFDDAKAEGMELRSLDIGGGFPAPSALELPLDLSTMMDSIQENIDRLFPDTEVCAEPGRYMCSTAVNLVTSVIGVKDRGHTMWYILDEGVYGTFSGQVFDHWLFGLEWFKTGTLYPSRFAGPSCDGIDVINGPLMVPELEIGDRILVQNCGSYTSASATTFNGFSLAPTYIWEELQGK